MSTSLSCRRRQLLVQYASISHSAFSTEAARDQHLVLLLHHMQGWLGTDDGAADQTERAMSLSAVFSQGGKKSIHARR